MTILSQPFLVASGRPTRNRTLLPPASHVSQSQPERYHLLYGLEVEPKSFELHLERCLQPCAGPLILHVSSLLIQSALYGGNPLGWIFGNWQVNGIVEFFTGSPLTVTTMDTANAGDSNFCFRPHMIGDPVPANRTRTGYYNRLAFANCNDKAVFGPSAPDFCFGTLGRNTLRGPGFQNFDFSVFRDFPLPGEKWGRIQFRAEFFNIFNHTNFNFQNYAGLSIGSAAAATFGVMSSTYDPRQIQFGAKWIF